MQNPTTDFHVLLPNNPFVPPNGHLCFIDKLSPELLSYIFKIALADEGTGDDEDMPVDYWGSLHSDRTAKEKETLDGDLDTQEGLEELESENEEGDRNETGDGDGYTDATGSSDRCESYIPFSIVISHVCRYWRNVVFSIPSLWTSLFVSPNTRPPYELLSALLQRSRQLPIDIYINYDPLDYRSEVEEPDDDDVELLFSMLTPHIHRWRTVELAVSDYYHMHCFLEAVSGSSVLAAPRLTTLGLYHNDGEMGEFENRADLSKRLTLFGGLVPSLTTLVLWGVHVDWDQPWISSAPNLTYLSLGYHSGGFRPSWVQFVTILRGAPGLKQFTLRQSGPSGEPPEWFIEQISGGSADLSGPIQLLQLSDFTLSDYYSPARAIGLFRKLYLPALKKLTLDLDNGDYTDLVHELVGPATSQLAAEEQPRSLLNRLESLNIEELLCPDEYIETLYGELQNLTTLKLSLRRLPLQFLSILGTPCTLAGRGDVWLPRLKELQVSGACGSSLRETVQKRKEMGVPISALYVSTNSHVLLEDGVWLRENLETLDYGLPT